MGHRLSRRRRPGGHRRALCLGSKIAFLRARCVCDFADAAGRLRRRVRSARAQLRPTAVPRVPTWSASAPNVTKTDVPRPNVPDWQAPVRTCSRAARAGCASGLSERLSESRYAMQVNLQLLLEFA